VNIRAMTILLTVSVVALGCGTKTLDLDTSQIESSSEPGVLAIVHERVEKIVVDQERLYWIGSHLRRSAGENIWFLHSCKKLDCASSLVTYDAQPFDTDHVFAVRGDEVYWYRRNRPEDGFCPVTGCNGSLLACSVAGCNGSPRVVASELAFTAATFDDDRFYFADTVSLSSVPLAQPGPRELVAAPSGVLRAVAIHGSYAYWRADGLGSGGQSLLVRGRNDGAGVAETTIADDLKCSANHDFSFTTDAASIYWTNNLLVGSINHCPLDGCVGASSVVVEPLRVPQGLQVDGSQLYYQYEPRPYEYTLSSCTLPACTEPLPLIEHLDAPGVLAIDDDYLYVATTKQDVSPENVSENTIARIRRLPKPDRREP